jgi:DNA (cytosine-5)-methyltransferase 3A
VGINVLSLFDGISSGQVALERAGIEIDKYYASEIDKYAIQVTMKNYPDTIQIGDVYNIDYSKLENIDIIIGGSPCTHWSIAKKDRETTSEGIGFDLFMQYIRAIKELKPKYFLYENNYSIHKNIKEAISEQLGVNPVMINSALLSAQQRKREYWTNIPNITQPQDKGLTLCDILQSDIDMKYYINENAIPKYIKNNIPKGLRSLEDKAHTVTASIHKGYGNDGLTCIRVGSFNKGGQGDRVYSDEGKSVTLSANGGGRGAKTGLYEVGDIIRRLSPIECERLQTLTDNYTEGLSDTQRYKSIGNGWTADVIAHIFSFLPSYYKKQDAVNF